MTLVGSMAEFVASLTPDAIPAYIVDGARNRLLDALSTSLASREVTTTRAVIETVRSGGSTGGGCTVLPTGGSASAQDAALINGTAIHAILYEDYHIRSADHPGAVVIPAALAAAESSEPLRGRASTVGDLLVSIVAGYEIQVRLGLVAATGIRARGFRTTGVLGAVAASAAAASAFGLSAGQTSDALGMGANMSSGFLEGFAHGTMEPYIHGGLAARNGILAGHMGYSGVRAAPLTFEGRTGYLAAFSDIAAGDQEFPGEWSLSQVIAKPYPLAGGKTSTVDSALALFEEGVDVDEIERILVRLPTRNSQFPGSDNKGPFTSMNEAQDSSQFVVAATLLGRPMKSLKTFMEGFADPDIAQLGQRIDIVGEDGRDGHGKIIATVEVTLRDGSTLVSEVDRFAEHLPTVESMSAKLRLLAEGAWPDHRVERVIELITGDLDTPLETLSLAMREAV